MILKRVVISAALSLIVIAPCAAADADQADTPHTYLVTGVVSDVVREAPRGEFGEEIVQVLTTRRGKHIELESDADLPVDQRLTVELSGSIAGGAQVEGFDTLAAAETAPAATPAVHQVYVALMTPAGWALSDNTNTAASVTDMVNKASAYWSSQTRGVVTFQVAQVVENYQSAYPCGYTPSFWDEALPKFGKDAAGNFNARGVNKHLLVVAPIGASDYDACDYGLGSVGAINASNNVVFVSDSNQSLFAHELGHNLGLSHANALRCSTAQDAVLVAPLPPDCWAAAYDDLLDVMGYSGEGFGEGNLNVPHLDDMGIQSDVITTVKPGETRTITIAPLSSTSGDPRGIRIDRGEENSYFVQYRTNSGRDSVATRNPYHPSLGVEVLREDPARGTGSVLLDTTPTSLDTTDYQRTLQAGSTFLDAAADLTVKLISSSDSGATVEIVNKATAAPPAPQEPAPETNTTPSEVTTVSQSVPGEAVIGMPFINKVTVTDQNGKPLGSVVATLQRLDSGSTSWVEVGYIPLDSTGVGTAGLRIRRTTAYRWVVEGKVSPVATVTVKGAITAKVSTKKVKRNGTVKLVGSITSVGAPKVKAQLKYGNGSWTSVTSEIKSGSRVAAVVKLKRKGTAYLRLRLASSSQCAGAVSKTLKVVVK